MIANMTYISYSEVDVHRIANSSMAFYEAVVVKAFNKSEKVLIGSFP